MAARRPIRYTPAMSFGFWDLALVVAVVLQAAAIAYVYEPRRKALLYTLPIPFTISTLALQRPVDATNVLGLLVLLLFTHLVRWLHYGARQRIVPSIAVAALVYLALGAVLGRLLPPGNATFWGACVLTAAVAALALRHGGPHVAEPGHRSPLPLWIKLPLLTAVVIGLLLLKQSLRGFMTVFPMVGVLALYEARKSLGTLCRQIPVLMICLLPMMILVRLASPRLGFGLALAAGWVLYLAGWAALRALSARGQAGTALSRRESSPAGTTN